MNVDKKEVMRTRDISPGGPKLKAHLKKGSGAVLAYLQAAAPNDGVHAPDPNEYMGHWMGDDVQVVGDYYDDYPEDENGCGLYAQALGYRICEKFGGDRITTTGPCPHPYQVVEEVEGWTDITETVIAELNEFVGEDRYELYE